MAGIRLVFENGDQLGRKLINKSKNFSERQTIAVQAAANRAAEEIEILGRADIRAGGDCGSARWQEGFRAKVSFQSRSDLRIRITHAVKYWKVFEFGAKILGRPLLWIPLSFSKAGQLKVRAKDYPEPLFRVDRAGKAPLLLDSSGPQYFGKESVRIPKKWHLRKITAQVSRKLKQYYREAMKNGR
jgi:hypothetical protein